MCSCTPCPRRRCSQARSGGPSCRWEDTARRAPKSPPPGPAPRARTSGLPKARISGSICGCARGIAAGKGSCGSECVRLSPPFPPAETCGPPGHGIKQMRCHAALGQHFCRHEPAGPPPMMATSQEMAETAEVAGAEDGAWDGRPLGQRREDGKSGCADQNREPCLESGHRRRRLAAGDWQRQGCGLRRPIHHRSAGGGVCPEGGGGRGFGATRHHHAPIAVRNAACTTSPGINTDTASR